MSANAEPSQEQLADVPRKMAKGAAWMVGMRLTDRMLGLISTMVLARVLVPGDFGVVAMATALLGMVEILSAFSFDLALIQNQNARRSDYDTAWTFNVFFGALTALVLCGLAGLAASFFLEPRVQGVIYCLALGVLIQSFQNIGVVAFRKELDFNKEFWLIILQRLTATGITIALAFALRSYWALVIGIVVSKTAGVVISYVLHPYRPRFCLSSASGLMAFSAWMLANNVVVFAAIKGYDFIVGRLAGVHALGLYSVAYEVSNLPTTEIVNPISRAIFPGLAKIAHRRQELRATFLHVAALVAIVTFPVGVGIVILSEPLVRVLLGTQWLAAAPLVAILAIYGVLRSLHAGTGDVYLALGVHRFIALINLPHVLIGWPAMIYLHHQFGIEGAAWAVICSSVVGIFINVAVMKRVLELGLLEWAACYWRPGVSTVGMAVVLQQITSMWPPLATTAFLFLQLLGYVLVCAAVYAGILLLLWTACGRPNTAERLLIEHIVPRRLTPRPAND